MNSGDSGLTPGPAEMTDVVIDRNDDTAEKPDKDQDVLVSNEPAQQPRSPRGLLRKDTPAVLDTSVIKRGFNKPGRTESIGVAEESEIEEANEEEEQQQENLTLNDNIVQMNDVEEEYVHDEVACNDLITDECNEDMFSDCTHEKTDSVEDVSQENECNIFDNMISVEISKSFLSKVQMSENVIICPPGKNELEVYNMEKAGSRGGTRPKCKSASFDSGMTKDNGINVPSLKSSGFERSPKAYDRPLTPESGGARAKKPMVTFKEHQNEGFHAHTSSGMKVLMRKTTPATLPSLQKMKVGLLVRNANEYLAEENVDNDETVEEKADDLQGACGEG